MDALSKCSVQVVQFEHENPSNKRHVELNYRHDKTIQ